MTFAPTNYRWCCLLAAGLVISPATLRMSCAQSPTAPLAVTPPVVTPPADPAAAMAQYRRALDDYNRGWQSYSVTANSYWNSIVEKRKVRNAKRAGGEALSIQD
ncbi:MAG TPA: hypothetical protein VF778_14445, partial [Xanthobacteraceae bacterium]